MSSRKKADAKKKAEETALAAPLRLTPPDVNHCVVCFKPHLADLTFEGSVIIQMSLIEKSTKKITVNASNLIITKAMWEEDVTLNRQEPSEIIVEDRGILNLVFEPSLLAQKGQLRLNFKGNMTEKRMSGFYVYDTVPVVHMIEEVQPDGTIATVPQKKPQICMLTQFDPCEARKCFPCWDDPAVKITYDIIIIVPKNSLVLGPTPIKATYPHRRDRTLEIAEFKTTPKLCTHALGFAFGYYDFLEDKTLDDEMTIRVYTPPGKKSDAEYALSFACRAIPFYQEYFGCKLNSQKLDLVAVPNHIYYPIEYWGLIFFRSADILVEPETAVYDVLKVSLKLCHEIVKQWFGNLVTHEWWTHHWLKEGFAAFAKFIFVNQMFPEMEVWSYFATHYFSRALRIDAHKYTHPVEVNISSLLEIEEAVDEICLFKSPALLRMAHRFIGDMAFRQGLELYLSKYRHGNAKSVDFWKCLQDASSKPVVSMMTSWSQTRGYPLISVSGRHEGKNKVLKLSQERFFYDSTERDPKGTSPVFVIPLTISVRNHPTSAVVERVMDTKTLSEVSIHDVAKTDWVKVNPGSIAYVRVKYPHEMFSLLVYGIREKSLPPLDRLNILDDAFAFLQAGYSNTTELLSLLEAFLEEDDFAVWTTISNIFEKFLRVFDHVGKAESFRAFGKFIYQQIFKKVGWSSVVEDESIQQKLLRGLILRMMAKFNHTEVVDQCKALFEGQYGEEGVPIPVDIKFLVYNTVVMYGDESTVRRFIRMYRDEDSAEERDRLAQALGNTRIANQIQHVLDLSISEEVRRAHTVYMFNAIGKSKLGREMTWQFFKDNFSTFRGIFGPHQASHMLLTVLSEFATEEKNAEIQEFFKGNPYPGTEWAIQQISESIRVNEMMLKREKNLTALTDYLESMANSII